MRAAIDRARTVAAERGVAADPLWDRAPGWHSDKPGYKFTGAKFGLRISVQDQLPNFGRSHQAYSAMSENF
ncbi:MAG: hypothetical protein QM703_02325 [Gemmatales bacterium]